MRSKKMAALAALSLVVATTPAVAAPVSTPAPAVEQVEGSQLAGGGFWAAAIGIALLAALILVIIEDEEIDLPASP